MPGSTRATLGIAFVVAALVFAACDGAGSAGASTSASALPAQSVAPSLVAGASAIPTDGASAVPATAAPTPKPTRTPKPTPTPNTSPAIIEWVVPKQEDCTGETGGSIHVSWRVARADGVSVSIDGPGLYDSYAGKTGEIDLPFGCSDVVLEHTYTLRTIGGTGPAATLTRTVKTRAPSIVSFAMGTPDCGLGEDFDGISMSFEIRAATGAELWRGENLYGTYTTKADDQIVNYNCSKALEDWTLITTGGYGDPASKTVTVNR